ncbi:hypothetical protein Huta_0382 [Halorhabdus utahensis DSM 12940]|uniref:Uncharacterized protein n=1 Tax=Halorhabdus utahensis (strain DSM 12940 / JCM 11049 / AX-2) TaxID=519442 RepID=C7NRD2_HALUD|nr:hypothetical protein [Halorhabdus utahensis]ACV10569.1 hypothetical protein Huta_0382 [Halorhabdus utahensis DSM 12940]
MTRSRPTPETDRSGRLALGRPILVALGLAVVLCMTALAGGVAGMPSGDADTQTTIQNTSNGTNLTYPPPNLSKTVVIGPSETHVKVKASYPVRTMAEQRRYRNKTGNFPWFKTDDALRHAFRERDEHLVKEEQYSEWSNTITDPKLGQIYVEMSFAWKEGARTTNANSSVSPAWSGGESAFTSNQSKLLLGPAFSDHLSNGTRVKIKVPTDSWVAENSTVESYTTGPHGQTRVYAWTVNQTGRDHRVVFNRSVLGPENTSESGPFGPAGGIVLSLLAVFLAVGVRSRIYRF